ncbi:hypothetical protein GCM10027048_20810 [Hymenobacter coalescens]
MTDYIFTCDTLKMRFPLRYILGYNESLFAPTIDRRGNMVFIQYLDKVPGLNLVNLDTTNDCAVVELSSKILGLRYPELLSKDTIEYALERVNTSGIINLDTHEVLNTADTLKVHHTLTRWLQHDAPHYNQALAAFDLCPSYGLKIYSADFSSIGYIGKSKANKGYFKIYDKGRERANKLHDLYSSSLTIDEREYIADYCQGSTQFETEVNGKKKLRELIADAGKHIYVKDLLLSKANPTAAIFKKLTGPLYKVIERPETLRSTKGAIEFAATLNPKDAKTFALLHLHGYSVAKTLDSMKSGVARSTVLRSKKDLERLQLEWQSATHPKLDETIALLQELKAELLSL